MLASQLAYAADHQIISVIPGQREDVYFEINLSGKVYLSIHAPEGGEQCADFWWIKWPFGNIQSLGRVCNSAELKIPGLGDFAISAKLRVGGAKQPLKIVASASEAIDHSVSVSFP